MVLFYVWGDTSQDEGGNTAPGQGGDSGQGQTQGGDANTGIF